MTASVRPLEIARAGWGMALLIAPHRTMGLLRVRRIDRRAVVVARILGARHLVQAIGSGVDPGPAVLSLGAWVDGVHSLTAFTLAAVDRGRARGALTDACIAGTWGLLTRRDARRSDGHAPPVSTAWTEGVARRVLPFLPGAGR